MELNFDEFAQNENISPEKKAFMRVFLNETTTFETQKETMQFFKKKIKEAREAGITFSNADILLLAGYLNKNASPKEQDIIQKILRQYKIG